MAGLSETQKRMKLLFENRVNTKTGEIYHKEFERDILKLRSLGDAMLKKDRGGVMMSSPFRRLILKYEYPRVMVGFLYKYALDGAVDFYLIDSDMLLVSEPDKTAVGSKKAAHEAYERYRKDIDRYGDRDLKLIISPNTTKKEVIDFINTHWKSFVSPKQHKSFFYGSSSRIREHYNAKRDYRIIELLETHKPKAVVELISKEYPGYYPTYVDIAKIKRRLKVQNITI